MTGTELQTLATEINGGTTIGETLLAQLLNFAKAIVEQRGPWMVLRTTDTSKAVTTANTWQTAIDLSTITRINRFYGYGEYPIRLFNGSTSIEKYRQIPIEERLLYKDSPNTFVYVESTKTLYLNGTVQIAGSLYINCLKDSADLINKGGIDYDDINALH